MVITLSLATPHLFKIDFLITDLVTIDLVLVLALLMAASSLPALLGFTPLIIIKIKIKYSQFESVSGAGYNEYLAQLMSLAWTCHLRMSVVAPC